MAQGGYSGTDPPAAHRGPHARAGRCSKKAVTLWGPCGEARREQSVPKGLYSMEKTHSRAIHEELEPLGRTHNGKFVEECLMWKWHHTGTGEECEEPSPLGKSERSNM